MEKQKATMKTLLFCIFTIHLATCQNLGADNRCYLESGSSSESFFVSEDQPVGTIIGQVRIVGDPKPGGNIGLRLKEEDSPVEIASGSKNLTLKKRLDKEGIEGPSSVFVNLICERLHTLDPGFVIPINIRVTDANDNSPIFINAPYVLNISEVTVVGTRVLQGVHAVDNDQQGPFSNIRYSLIPGMHSEYFEFENELEGTLVLKKSLDYESLKIFDVHIRAQDHGEPAQTTDTVLTVYVMDADDQNPRFLDDRYTATVQSHAVVGTVLTILPRDIKAFDQDKGINAPVYYTFNGLGLDYHLFKINRNSGKVTLAKNITSDSLFHPATLVIRATQDDNPDRYALSTLTVTKESINNGIQFLHDVFFISALESSPQGTIIGTLANNKPGQSLKYFVSDQNVLKTFGLNKKGELSLKKKLDFEERAEYVFKVFATDGITNDSSVVNITVEDVNEWEPRFRYPHYEFYTSGIPKELLGRIEAADGDTNDQITLTLVGSNATSFFITPMGELRLRDEVKRTGLVTFDVVATDNGHPPKSSRVPVSVHFPGDENSASINAKKSSAGTPILLVGLGTSLMLLAIVVAVLIAYIFKARKKNGRELPSLQQEKNHRSGSITGKMSNPVFNDRSRNPTATAMGGLPNLSMQVSKSKIPSPKVHPAPQPPMWPNSTTSSRVKKLSWGEDKTDSESSENLNNMDVTPKVMESTNLTVYF
ncbi:protocadherin-16 [Coccinella septempunctata]|uniref:protocadherin-16 n=1 Tax=Coccinella septempunctata TaxID=41139 RepID=UPI001D07C2E5|nr:protocadherin-16 [Coccinella septempunctata]